MGALVAAIAVLTCARVLRAEVPTPEAHFGFRMGAEGRLATAEQIEEYFNLVALQSDRVKLVDIGPTTDGHRTLAAIVSAPYNIRNLDRIRAANQQLADPRTLTPEAARQLAATHKAVVAIGAGMHPIEVGPTLAVNELLYSLATGDDPDTLDALDNIVLILIPSLNPDGHRLVVDWYNKEKGTPYEGGVMPWLFHKYAGHDLNRDSFMMNMAESQNLARFFYTEWHPQVFLTMHQMESEGPRFFAPPMADPVNPNYDPIISREAALLGSAMTLALEQDGHRGAVSNAMFDYFWPGYEDSAPLGHNTVCLLTEAASVKVATSIGTWTLRDIVDYDLSSVHGLLQAVAAYREQIVRNFYDMGARAVDAGLRGGPFAFVIPPEQRDKVATKRLEELLLQGGIEIQHAIEPFRADGEEYPAGADVILLAQPYRAYVKTLLERQDYPLMKRPGSGSPPVGPYDATGWTLPAQMGVDVRTIARPFQPPATSRVTTASITAGTIWNDKKPTYYVVEAQGNGGVLAANRLLAAGLKPSWLTGALEARGYMYTPGSIVVAATKATLPALQTITRDLGMRADGMIGKPPADLLPIGRPRLGLYKSWVSNVDEGWTRWLLEQYGFPYTSLADADVRAGNLRARFDVIVVPSAPAAQIVSGHPMDAVPTEFAGGLGDTGVQALTTFVQNGGTLICLDQATSFAISAFELPIRDVAHEAGADMFFCPGSLVRVDLDPTQPLSYGMSHETTGFFAFSSAYDVLQSRGVEIVARYARRDVLVSGWLEGESYIAGRPAVLRVQSGSGHIVLLGFSVQHRAQSLATFRLLFNSILTAR